MANWLEGKIVENRHWTGTLYSLKVAVDNFPTFTAGQFTRIALDIDGARVARPYSLVNPPSEPLLDFYSVLVDDGFLSPALHKLKAGDPIYVSDLVSGFLVLEEIPAEHKKLWLIATGTGLGPFLSILQTSAVWTKFERIVLVHAVRFEAELAYRPTIEGLLREHSHLAYIPFVSRENPPYALKGRIPAALANGSLEEWAKCKMDTADTHLMLCGNPAMLKDVQGAMQPRGFLRNRRRSPGHITTENYW